jgi:molecular chaperone GrpE
MTNQNASQSTDGNNRDVGAELDAVLDEAIQGDENNMPGGSREEQLMAQIEMFRDRELRAHAELENYRKRSARDVEQQIKFANVAIVRDLLEVVDNLVRAIETAEKKNESSSLLEGVRLVHQQFLTVLAKFNCKPIEAVGKQFDPNLHQAIANFPNEAEAGTIIQQASVGYMMHDRVVRPSHVIVSAGPAQT